MWGWEGCFPDNGCCHGSCTHVWNYAQAFPHLVAEAPPGDPWRPWGRGALLLPQEAGTDGMFALVTRSVGSGS